MANGTQIAIPTLDGATPLNGASPSQLGAPTPNGGADGSFGNGQDSPNTDDELAPSSALDQDTEALFDVSEEELYSKLVKRGKAKLYEIKLNEKESDAIVDHVIQDFQDTDAGNFQSKLNNAEMTANWRGIVADRDFPFEGCANLVVPFTSVLVETMKSRIRKAVFGGDFVTKISLLDKQIATEELDEANKWFKWEIDKIVKLSTWFDDALHAILVSGVDISIPCYNHDSRYLHSWKVWELDENKQLSDHIIAGLQELIDEPSSWGDEKKIEVIGTTGPGLYTLNDGGSIEFSVDSDANELRADVWRNETIFDGVRVNQIQYEDLVVANTNSDIEKIPFLGCRLWYTGQDYRDGLKDGFFIDYGSKINQEIIESFDYDKIPEEIQRPTTDMLDEETSTDSTGSTMSHDSYRYGEVYRWEGWWVWDPSGEAYGTDKLLQPATQIAVWVALKARKIIKIARLEDLNKDGLRSGIKMGFIREPGRFFDISLAEWVRHTQAELDAVHNQRSDAGLLYNIPFGFYKPSAGIGKDAQPLKMEPGKFYPVADPQGVSMPRSNWQPTVSFAEEKQVVEYGLLQAGLTGAATGQAQSKRQSASEFVGLANAIDTRSEDIISNIVSALEQMLLRILGLYQQFGPKERIFRVGGEGGAQITSRFQRDRLHGKIVLQMMANLQQLNQELQKQVALDMMQILLNQLLIQLHIVGPDTIYEAVKTLMRLSNYNVPIHKPDMPPMSDPPDVEEQQIFAGQKPIGPTMAENIEEHMSHHAMTAADSKLMSSWSAKSRQMLAEHIQETLKVQQAKQVVAQQNALLAAQLKQQMIDKGVNPGMSGSQNQGDNLGPGTQEEGVEGAGGSPSAPTPLPQ